MRLYRVFPWLAGAAVDAPGGALFVPRQGSGRLDNPTVYGTRYLAAEAAGAVAEVFGWRARWDARMLRGAPNLPGSVQALAIIDAPDLAICNLDDPQQLVDQSLRPSTVITRDVDVTQAWSLRLYNERRWSGASWWSFYDARWTSVGLWNPAQLAVTVEPLALDHEAILAAASVLRRRIVKTPGRRR